MGVTVREKVKGSGVYWIFVAKDNKRRSFKIGNQDVAKRIAKKVEADIMYARFGMGIKNTTKKGGNMNNRENMSSRKSNLERADNTSILRKSLPLELVEWDRIKTMRTGSVANGTGFAAEIIANKRDYNENYSIHFKRLVHLKWKKLYGSKVGNPILFPVEPGEIEPKKTVSPRLSPESRDAIINNGIKDYMGMAFSLIENEYTHYIKVLKDTRRDLFLLADWIAGPNEAFPWEEIRGGAEKKRRSAERVEIFREYRQFDLKTREEAIKRAGYERPFVVTLEPVERVRALIRVCRDIVDHPNQAIGT